MGNSFNRTHNCIFGNEIQKIKAVKKEKSLRKIYNTTNDKLIDPYIEKQQHFIPFPISPGGLPRNGLASFYRI